MLRASKVDGIFSSSDIFFTIRRFFDVLINSTFSIRQCSDHSVEVIRLKILCIKYVGGLNVIELKAVKIPTY